MILGFKQYFPWKGEDGKPEPTNFREKILAGAGYFQPSGEEPVRNGPDTHSVSIKYYTPKIHTFREDKHDRWKAGMKVSMVYRGAGYKILHHFNEGIPELGTIKSIQKIKITCAGSIDPKVYREHGAKFCIKVDGKEIEDTMNVVKLVQNDGFYGLHQFCKWFKIDWQGKILHFTDFRYE